ncbi:helix-turn-helix protein [Ruminiclostridium sufflavum DSM 19573]|uniref:Helix-turn-helix protein n=1 Tax=Ruminiclostridium sufflavum DSM 19573 TaxID=1121337 RepID=A0A318XFK2_9FIRM|nr:helix-turn-helix domain-containing protein [Ruminiclostridium sufflavum]PYG84338.1 helix-turn-helix protein [Ruminiclostridium sufflavum DSM 19573]
MYMNIAFDKVCHKGSILSQSARFVYLCLCKHADNTNQSCFPSLNRIAQIVGKSISTIKRAVRELCGCGAIKRTPRYRKDGGQTSNLYEIVEYDFVIPAELPDNKEKEAPDNKAGTEIQNSYITKSTLAENISFSVSDTKAQTKCTEEEKASASISNAAEQAEKIQGISQENEESKPLHIKSENNSLNPTNGMNENMEEAEQIYIEENKIQEDRTDQARIKAAMFPENKDNQISNIKPDNEPMKQKCKFIKDISIKRTFARLIKTPVFHIIAACKTRFSTKSEPGGGHR